MSAKRVISLMNEKNHYLEKFYSLNERELKNFLNNNFDQLNEFYEDREKILEIIKYIDSQIEEISLQQFQATETERLTIKSSLIAKERYVEQIMRQDLEVLSCIESAKNEIIRELQALKKNKKAVAGYRAPVFQKRMDEEV